MSKGYVAEARLNIPIYLQLEEKGILKRIGIFYIFNFTIRMNIKNILLFVKEKTTGNNKDDGKYLFT